MVLAQALASITESDLQRLIDNEVAETRTIEYKLALPGTRDAERKEFLADVSSFANANGGDLLYGVEAIRGVPRALRGLSSGSEDDDILRLESMIRDGITPR